MQFLASWRGIARGKNTYSKRQLRAFCSSSLPGQFWSLGPGGNHKWPRNARRQELCADLSISALDPVTLAPPSLSLAQCRDL